MNITCIICSDLFIPGADIYSTTCGHMFHYTCLMNWLERSKSCPQCRNKVTEKTIHRVFFNLANVDAGSDDVGTLLNKVEGLQFKVSLSEKTSKQLREKVHKLESQNRGLREEISELENKERLHESVIHALKDQITYFKSRAKETDRLSAEIVKLKNSLKDMDNVQLAINGTRDQVNDILRNDQNVESLALMAAVLKKTLLDVEKNKREIEFSLKKAKNEINRYRKDYSSLECQNSELRRTLQQMKAKFDKEKQHSNKKISETNTNEIINITDSSISFDDSLLYIESPQDKKNTSNNTSLPVSEKVEQIVNSDSPYLPLKSNATNLDCGSFLNAKCQTRSGSFTIFKSGSSSSRLEEVKMSRKNDVNYNGLGGSSKEDIFPSPKPVPTGIKRSKASATVSSSKFRKLSAAPSLAKVTNYVSHSHNQ